MKTVTKQEAVRERLSKRQEEMMDWLSVDGESFAKLKAARQMLTLCCWITGHISWLAMLCVLFFQYLLNVRLLECTVTLLLCLII